jgi:hypothetical protein
LLLLLLAASVLADLSARRLSWVWKRSTRLAEILLPAMKISTWQISSHSLGMVTTSSYTLATSSSNSSSSTPAGCLVGCISLLEALLWLLDLWQILQGSILSLTLLLCHLQQQHQQQEDLAHQ